MSVARTLKSTHRLRPVWVLANVLSLLLALAACKHEGAEDPDTGTNDLPIRETDAGREPDASDPDSDLEPSAECLDAPDGEPCSHDRLCIRERCVPGLCGDGVRIGTEACDDGNAFAGDGCDPACRRELSSCGDGTLDEEEECDDGNRHELDACSNACTENRCGNQREDGLEECDDGNVIDDDACSNACLLVKCRNGRLDPGEECDDGNRIHDDGCSNACKVVVCGNGRAEESEECDDGNAVDDDACANACTNNECGNMRVDPGEACDGATSEHDCAPDCSEKLSNSACTECQETHCRNYMMLDIDLVGGCFENADPDFVQRCVDLVDCARAQRCAYSANGALQCYCGSSPIETCSSAATPPDGPCKLQYEAAVGSDAPSTVIERGGDFTYPGGWAYYLLECQRDHCEECSGS